MVASRKTWVVVVFFLLPVVSTGKVFASQFVNVTHGSNLLITIDMVYSQIDHCPNTPAGEEEDERGCSASQRDTDYDGIFDDEDICPYSTLSHPNPENITFGPFNEIGCTPEEMNVLNGQDEDSDGVPDYLDQCPGTTAAQIPGIDSNGCHPDQIDSDNDGVPDYQDAYPLQHNTMCPAN